MPGVAEFYCEAIAFIGFTNKMRSEQKSAGQDFSRGPKFWSVSARTRPDNCQALSFAISKATGTQLKRPPFRDLYGKLSNSVLIIII